MGENFFTNYYQAVAMILYGIGFTNLIVNKNLVKKVIGLNIAIAAAYLFLGTKGFVTGRAPPIIADGIADAAMYVNPIPAGMILTGIVISFSVTAFSLALIVSLYRRYQTLYLDEIMLKVAQEEGE
ncbi:MAG: cation:proton antiporter subunit C [Treponema sp.]|nr:cation:proton antiporter subunit C [Treponema sp.]